MYTKQALRELGVTRTTLSPTQKQQLDERGFIIVENVLTPTDCNAMRMAFERLHAAEKGEGGHEGMAH